MAVAPSSSSMKCTASTRAQQDAFLPYVEDGTLIFIGATTENPSFELNNALLSRARVYVLKSLDEAALRRLAERALSEEKGLGKRQLSLPEESLQLLLAAADGDGRRLLNLLENAADLAEDGQAIGPSCCRTCWAMACGASTRAAKRFTTRFPRCTSRCAAPARRHPVLVCPHARWRLRSAVHRPARGAHGQ
jgi:hypothetical protein